MSRFTSHTRAFASVDTDDSVSKVPSSQPPRATFSRGEPSVAPSMSSAPRSYDRMLFGDALSADTRWQSAAAADAPSLRPAPSVAPSAAPSVAPFVAPSAAPSVAPSLRPAQRTARLWSSAPVPSVTTAPAADMRASSAPVSAGETSLYVSQLDGSTKRVLKKDILRTFLDTFPYGNKFEEEMEKIPEVSEDQIDRTDE